MSRFAREIEMIGLRLAGIGAGIAAALTVGGCAYDDYGRGYGGGSGYYQGGYDQPPPAGYDQGGYAQGYDQGGYDQGGYDQGGYGGGYAGGGYYGGGGGYDGFVDGPDYGYGYGWYDNFYYPGFGVFIYDSGGHRHPWRGSDHDYWQHHPRSHGDQPPRPGDGNWRGPAVPSRGGGGHAAPGGAGNTPASDARGRFRGYDRGGMNGAQGGGNAPPAYMRRPMTQEQRVQQQQDAPGMVPMRGGFYRQNQAPQGQQPQGRAFQAAPGGQSQAQPTVNGPQSQQQQARTGVAARGGRSQPSGDARRNGEHHHHDD